MPRQSSRAKASKSQAEVEPSVPDNVDDVIQEEPKPKKRGRPPKATAGTTDAALYDAAVQPKAPGRKPKAVKGAEEGEELPVGAKKRGKKQAASTLNAVPDGISQVSEPSGLDATARQTRTLPPRPRLEHPGALAPEAPRPRRTSAQVKADAEAKLMQKREKELERQQRIKQVALLEAEEERADAERELYAVRTLADTVPGNDGSGSKEFDDIEDTSDQSEYEKPRTKAKSTRGGTRLAVVAAKAELKALAGGQQRAPASKAKFDLKIKSSAAPSGLIDNWQSNAQATKVQHGRLHSEIAPNSNVLGGLADDDTFAKRDKTILASPASAPRKAVAYPRAVRDFHRENEYIKIDIPETSDSDGDAAQVLPKNVAFKPRQRKATKATSSSRSAPVVQPVVATTSSLPPSDTTLLPEFARANWLVILPTAYHLAGCINPWEISKTSSAAEILQRVVDDTCPQVSYRLAANQKLFEVLLDRIGEKRSMLGRHAIKVVDEHIASLKLKTAEQIADYVKYATRPDGPALYGKPTPRDCVVSSKDPAYIKPDEPFQSKFVLDVFTAWAKAARNSRGEYGALKGALALAAAAVERAFLNWITGSYVLVGRFGVDEGYGQVTEDYLSTIAAFSDNRWEIIMGACGFQKPAAAVVAVPALQQMRRKLYIPPSPAKNT